MILTNSLRVSLATILLKCVLIYVVHVEGVLTKLCYSLSCTGLREPLPDHVRDRLVGLVLEVWLHHSLSWAWI